MFAKAAISAKSFMSAKVLVSAFGVVVVSVLALLALAPNDTRSFLPGSCQRVEQFLSQHVVGQDMALRQLVDAVCTHLNKEHPSRPLIISVHGPPGTGKTFSHTLLARALYNTDPERALQCPGHDCRGAKVIYGLDFIRAEREEQLGAVRSAIFEHAASTKDPLIVIEEYDKLDCPSRGMLRQLMQNPEMANATLNRAIVLLESNLGLSELETMVRDFGRDKITPEQAEKELRDLVFTSWRSSDCEGYSDTMKLVSLIDFFLPYFPLERPQVKMLVSRSLQQWAKLLWHEKLTQMAWEQEVVNFLTDRVDFDGAFPLEGGKQVTNVATRYLARLVRQCLVFVPSLKAGKTRGETTSENCHGASGDQGDSGSSAQRWKCGPGDEGYPVMKVLVQGNSLVAEMAP